MKELITQLFVIGKKEGRSKIATELGYTTDSFFGNWKRANSIPSYMVNHVKAVIKKYKHHLANN
jgi:hypothetical protein